MAEGTRAPQTLANADWRSYGHSVIVDPEGNTIADTGDQEGMVIAPIGVMVDPDGLGFSTNGTVVDPSGWALLKSRR